MEDCILEANFELVEETPINLDLEVKQYFDGAGQTVKEILFEEADWKYDSNINSYMFWFGVETHNLEDLVITNILLWDEPTQTYKPALMDYKTETDYSQEGLLLDTVIYAYSEAPCKGKIILFGKVITT